MLVRIVWKRVADARRVVPRGVRLQALLEAARNTRYYKPLLDAIGSRNPPDPATPCTAEEALRGLAPVDWQACRSRPGSFVNRQAAKPQAQRLFHPLPAAERTALLAEGFHGGRGVRIFERPRRSRLIRFRPDIIAGPVGVLRRLAEAVEDRGAPAPKVSHAVIAFSGLRFGFLSEEARDLFWRVFRVPVFGQYLGLAAELLAWECEAHEGWHVREEEAVFEVGGSGGDSELLVTSLSNLRRPVLRLRTGLTARIERSTCGCGETALRVLDLRRRGLRPAPCPESAAVAVSCAAD